MNAALQKSALALLLALLLAACGSRSSGTIEPSQAGPVSSAGDILETGLQGQIPLQDQLSGKSALGYHKGLRLLGQNNINKRGSNFALAWVDDCAYVSTASLQQVAGIGTPYADPAGLALNGTAVIDVSNPAAPQLRDILQSTAMLSPHESLQGNQARKILLATASGGSTVDVYDASDCRHPVLRSSVQIDAGIALPDGLLNVSGPFRGHAMCVAPDGMTAYAASTETNNAIIDLSDLDHPKALGFFTPAAHDCDVSADGNRLYLAVFGLKGLGAADVTGIIPLPYGPQGFNGLLTLDSSEIQQRKANAQLREISRFGWTPQGEDQGIAGGGHTVRVFGQGARHYAFTSDEIPAIAACPWAHGRIIDITDETQPFKVSDVALEVQKSANCPTSIVDLANYSSHYVGFNDLANATTLFTTNYAGGLRVLDIRDPAKPVEIAYWHPAPLAGTVLNPASPVFAGSGSLWDAVPNYVRYRPESGQIWITGFSAGFQVLQFTPSAGPLAPQPLAH